MKNLILIISLLGIVSVNAQISTHIITISPQGDSISTNYKYGDLVKFAITNVNTFKINGAVTSSKTDIDFGVPSLISEQHSGMRQGSTMIQDSSKEDKKKGITDQLLNLKSFKRLSDAAKISLQEAFDSIIHKEEMRIANLKNDFLNTYAEFIGIYYKIRSYASFEDYLLNQQLSDSLFISDTSALKSSCKLQFISLYSDSSIENAKKQISTAYESIIRKFSKLKLFYEELRSMQKTDSLFFKGILYTSDKANSIEIKEAKLKLEQKIYFEDEFANATKMYAKLSEENNRNAIINQSIAGIDLYTKIRNASFTVYTDAIPLNGDEVTLVPILKYSNGKVAKEYPSYSIRTSGGLKINFSTGYLLSFRGDDNYKIYKNSMGETIGVVKGNNNILTHALGAMTHVYCRSPKDWNYALSTGLSLANNESIAFYLGGSMLFKEKNRLAISAGISFIQLQKLDKTNLKLLIKDEDRYEFLSQNDDSINYDKVYRPAFFAGITYNITTNK